MNRCARYRRGGSPWKTSSHPYWRILKAKGELNPKYPGGITRLKQRLESEGHSVVQNGKRFFVVEFEKRLQELGP